MRQIAKKPEDIKQFNDWAKSRKFKGWTDFSVGQKSAYEKTRDYIAANEQAHLSAYTEKPLGDRVHIDHFRKRNLYPALTFDYSNFLVDDLNDNYGACYKDNHAGEITKATFEGDERIFCPVRENMADFIEFTIDGKMKPKTGLSAKETKRVNETIRVFNLNHKTLKDRRASIIQEINSYRMGGLSSDEIRHSLPNTGFPTLVNWTLSLPPLP
ncbi:MAG: TIGR02646 family protein [Bacteroidales bacterium]|nr:TIGR02646 family protein [Bacteroidales bacterium]